MQLLNEGAYLEVHDLPTSCDELTLCVLPQTLPTSYGLSSHVTLSSLLQSMAENLEHGHSSINTCITDI